MLSAEYLFLMTDVDCLYTSNPRIDPDAKPIPVVSDISALEADVSSAGSDLGTGGMGTKIVAAKLGTAAGVTTIITQASKPGNVAEIVDHLEALQLAGLAAASPEGLEDHSPAVKIPAAPLHTRFLPSLVPIRDRSFWLLHGLTPRGVLYIDEGAYRALRKKAGLLPVGIVGIEGNFAQQEAVRLVVVSRDWKSIDAASSQDSSASQSRPSSRPSSRPTSRPTSRTRAPHSAGLTAGNSAAATSNLAPSTATSAITGTAALSPSLAAPAVGSGASGASVSGGAGASAGASAAPPSLQLQESHSSTSDSDHGMTPLYDQLTALPPGRSELLPAAATLPHEVGRALVNYAAPEVAHIKGLQSADIERLLGYADSEYVALRENISLFDGKDGKEGRGRRRKGRRERREREKERGLPLLA